MLPPSMNSYWGYLQKFLARIMELTPPAILIWITIVTLIPHNSQFRSLYLMAHYGLLPLFFKIHCFSRLLEPKAHIPGRWNGSDLSMILYLIFILISFLGLEGETDRFFFHLLKIYRIPLIPFLAFWLVRLSQPNERPLAQWVSKTTFISFP